ncbi:hypothetical protein [Oryzomonas rubra]|uniref:Uncharacterized protein n=1 Tax=Oryzomonas rubra TaxID=2509454 RepID=A0A5A9XB10_9BACT|nr:hypothetical protein [Oryzomonas rubra]KAA0889783.1 hypothetical protein ET418_13495 [Oryzomonas rubra]
MSSIRPFILGLWLPALVAFGLAGCGDSNSQSTFSADSHGAHVVATWLPGGHSAAATTNISACAECHGSDYAGGISKVACTQCHMGDQQHVHPLFWGDYTYSHHAVYVAESGIAACTNIYCHGKSLTGVTGSGPSCSSCHLGGPMQIHPASIAVWKNVTSSNQSSHGVYVLTNGITTCANVVCHGANLEGVSGSGMSCQSCHTLNWQ